MIGRRSFVAMCSIFSFALSSCFLCFGPFGLPLVFLSVPCFRFPLLCSLWYATEFYSRWFTPSLAVCSLCLHWLCLLTPKLLCRFLKLSSPKKIAPCEWFFLFYYNLHPGAYGLEWLTKYNLIQVAPGCWFKVKKVTINLRYSYFGLYLYQEEDH